MTVAHPNRRQVLKLGGALALTPLATQLFVQAAATAATPAHRPAVGLAPHPAPDIGGGHHERGPNLLSAGGIN
ncbi:hypothetical protein ACX80E_12595 [Arthrobacter sp. TMN-49]